MSSLRRRAVRRIARTQLPLPSRFQYEEEVQRNPLNYDNWFDYVKLEESTGDVDRIREVSAIMVSLIGFTRSQQSKDSPQFSDLHRTLPS